MSTDPKAASHASSAIPPDDPARSLVIANADDPKLPHIGLAGDTYTVLLSGKDTAGKFCLIDMFIPPGGGPPPHQHDFEETFILLEGEVEASFRGVKSVVKAGETLHIPANAPHQFHNSSSAPVRLLCICAPAMQEEYFAEVGVPVATPDNAAAEDGAHGTGRHAGKGAGASGEVSDGICGEGLTCGSKSTPGGNVSCRPIACFGCASILPDARKLGAVPY